MDHVQPIVEILLVEDSPSDARLLRETLLDAPDMSFRIETVQTLQAALSTLTESHGTYDIVLLDLNLPDSHGLETCQTLMHQFPCIPVVILTSQGNEELATQAVMAGAQDFIFKHRLDTFWLAHEIRHAINRSALLRRLQQAESALLREVASATQANHAKSQFLANMSHEIRTPLASILMAAETMQHMTRVSEEQSSFVRIILSSGTHLLHLLNDILDLAKVEAGHLQIEKKLVDPAALVNEVLHLLEPLARKKGIAMIAHLEELPPHVATDPTRFRQILTNLVSNAIKFTHQGKVSITAKIAEAEAQLQFYIEDTGCGISPENQSQLFQPFRQETSGTARLFGGTGLGLCLAKALAHALGGDVKLVRSAPNCGSIFLASINIVRAGEVTQAGPVQRKIRTQASKCLDGSRILLAEDNRDIQLLVATMLENSGAQVDKVDNGEQAIKAALDKDYHLVLMDIQMPIVNGYEAVRRLRAAGYSKPIFALTASVLSTERELALEAGCTGILAKPVSIHELEQVILSQNQPILPVVPSLS